MTNTTPGHHLKGFLTFHYYFPAGSYEPQIDPAMGILDLFPSITPPRLSYIHPLPGTEPLTPLAAILPPLLYYLALLLLPPFLSQSPTQANLTALLRNTLALISASLFIRLPLAYHVPFSVGLTYQLALIGLYGSARILDAFFISRYYLHRIPRRVRYYHHSSSSPPTSAAQFPPPRAPQQQQPSTEKEQEEGEEQSYFSRHFLRPGQGQRVTQHARTAETDGVEGWQDRCSWALELELSMRGQGFAWTSADVRHTKRTWHPTARDRVESIAKHGIPVLVASWGVIRGIYARYLDVGGTTGEQPGFDALPFAMQIILTAALGAFLMAAFSVGHSLFAIALAPLEPHPLSFFPPLYTLRVWEIDSVRCFWSYGWHRLFSRLFLVYGVWPGEWVERRLLGKGQEERADVGKVLGAFLSSAFVHSFAGHTVVPGGWRNASGEAWFFALNGLAVVGEEAVVRAIMRMRRKRKSSDGAEDPNELSRWYDGVIGRIWWVAVLLYTGRNFARGWVLAGLVREMAFA